MPALTRPLVGLRRRALRSGDVSKAQQRAIEPHSADASARAQRYGEILR
jgi:hypothetical protein